MNHETILQTNNRIFARMAFTQNVLTEGQLLGLFTAAAHKKKKAVRNLNNWFFDTQKQLKQLQDFLYSKSNYCPTLRNSLIARFERYIKVIKRFEEQFQIACPCAKNGAGNTLKKLSLIKAKAQIILMYINV